MSSPRDPRAKLTVLALTLVSLAGGSGCSSDRGDADREPTTPATDIPDDVVSFFPDAVESLYRRRDCDARRCWRMVAVAPPGGCPKGAYAELIIYREEPGGLNILAYPNDTVSAPLRAGQRVRFDFSYDAEEDGIDAGVNGIHCRP